MFRWLTLTMIMLLLPAQLLHAESWSARSSSEQVAVVELFVSEGCGLCPPAEHWLNNLSEQGIQQSHYIPLTYHIDYLNDKKGWVDRFAKADFSNRQRQLARLNLYKTVFTPEFFISGEVVHSWREHGVEVVNFVNSFDPEADILLRAERDDIDSLNTHIEVTVNEKHNQQYAKLYLLVKESDIISHVQAGDNRGTTFNHQDLIRELIGPFDLDQDGHTLIDTEITLHKDWNLDKLSLVAFVQNLNDGFILQGVSLALD